MRKQLLLTLLLLLALVVVACGGNNVEEPPANVGEETNNAAEEPAAEEPAEEPAEGEQVTLIIESWRNDDLAIWQDQIIPAFEAQYPNINVEFQPTAPAEYNGVLNTKLEAGTAGDLITCRPFDASLELFNQGHLASLNDLPGMENFSDVAKSAWQTDDGATTFCVPMASVIHGFIYNQTAFEELGLEEPATEPEFLALLEAIKADGTYTPLSMGTVDLWESATMGYQNIGPNYWKGEEGRLGLIDGSIGYDEDGFVEGGLKGECGVDLSWPVNHLNPPRANERTHRTDGCSNNCHTREKHDRGSMKLDRSR